MEDCLNRGVSVEECNFIDQLKTDIGNTHKGWLLLVLILFMISNISRALKWMQLLSPLGYKASLGNAFWSIMLGYFANLGFPRMGEVVRAGSLSRYEKIPLSAVMGTVVTDRISDVIMLAVVLLIGFVLEFDLLWGFISENSDFSPTILAWLAGAGVLGLVSIWLLRKRLIGLWRKHIGARVQEVVRSFVGGLKSVSKLNQPWAFVGHSVFIWVMYYLMTYFCFSAFDPTAHLGLQEGLIVFIFGTLGIVIPMPGGLGSYHYLVMAALMIYGIGQVPAFSFAIIIFFSIQIFCNVIFGLLALVLLPFINR